MKKAVRFFSVQRFFRSIEGFYMGSLDLTGRHPARLQKLQARWNAFLHDFLTLALHAREYSVLDYGGNEVPKYQFLDEIIWMDFCQKWKIPESYVFEDLLTETCETLCIISEYPLPKIQQLCLADLPVELLDNVFRHASMEQARLLGSTCSLLNEVGRNYIFEKRRFALAFPRNQFWDTISSVAVEDHFRYLENLARSARDSVLAKAAFFHGRPDILNKIKHLTISDEWQTTEFDGTVFEEFQISTVEEGFHTPIYRSFTKILGLSHNVVSVMLNNIVLTLDSIRCLSMMLRLHTLGLRWCLLPSTVKRVLTSQRGRMLSTSTVNLHIMTSSAAASVWHILLIFPNLRTLSLHSTAEFDLSVPILDLSSSSIFSTLECISLTGVDAVDVPLRQLVGWVRAGGTLRRLTHFRLRAQSSISDNHLISVLETLHTAPLTALVLEGLAHAEFRLFDMIAYHLPHLRGLTLVRRASNRQRENRPVQWPHPAWEYSTHLVGFTKLEHFGWNNCLRTIDPSTYPLLRLEHNFQTQYLNWQDWLEDRDNDYFDDDLWTPRLFARRCPTLKSFVSSARLTPAYRFRRSSDDSIVVETPRVEGNWLMWLRRWNPSRSENWPTITPGIIDDRELP